MFTLQDAMVYGGFLLIGSFALSLLAVLYVLSIVLLPGKRHVPSGSKPLLWLFPVLLSIILAMPYLAADKLNGLSGGIVPEPDAAALTLHDSLQVVDLHADTLMWTTRDLNLRSTVGHVDVPRLLDGNVAVQGFTIVAKTPVGQNFDRNGNDTDALMLLAVSQVQPVSTWLSPMQRAVYQCRRLRKAAADSGGTLRMLQWRGDLTEYLRDREASAHRMTAGFLGVEGLHALEGNIANLDVLFEEGVRMAAFSHFFDTLLGGSAHGIERYGLTPLGHRVLARMEELGIIVDLAHASEPLIDDVLDVSTRPVLVSHTGVRGTCESPRNLHDAHLRRIAESGGVVGIAYFKTAVCGSDVEHIVRAIAYTGKLIGWRHVGLGSDFDGTVKTPVDTANLAAITHALMHADDVPGDAIPGIMGGNALRVLAESFPPRPAVL